MARKKPTPEYTTMLEDFGAICWHCGRTSRDRPRWWFSEWRIDRAHIVNKPRVEDRRAVVLLCRLCHRIHHGDCFRQIDTAPITLAGMLWLKLKLDPSFYDRKWLQAHTIRSLPRARKPDGYCQYRI